MMLNAKKIAVKATATMVAVTMLTPSIFAYAADDYSKAVYSTVVADSDDEVIIDEDGRLYNHVKHSDLNFEDYEYVEMYEEDFDAIVEPLADLVDDTSNEKKVMDIVKEMEGFYRELDANSCIASVYSDLDADDETWDQIVEDTSELSTSVVDKIYINYNLIANSANADALREYIDDDDEWEYILDYKPMTDEQKAWDKRETELGLEYDVIYNTEYTCNIAGKEYTEEELDEAQENGTVSYFDYLQGLGDIYTARNEAFTEIYIELVDIRNKLARSYGYDNYAEYAYDRIYDRNYTPDDLNAYRESVKKYYSPLLVEVLEMYRNDYSDILHEMWDVEVTPEEVKTTVEKYLPLVSEDLMESYNYMWDHNLCNIEIDSEKAPGAYTTQILGDYNAPFIFNCAEGDYSDIGTLVHEFGHYNEMYFAPEDEWYMGGFNLDLAEIHSQGLELIFTEYDEEIYGEYTKAMEVYNLLNQVYVIVEGAKEDAFQIAVYEYEGELTADVINELYYDACVEYGDYDLYNTYYLAMYGYTPANQILEWQEIHHTFQSPLYYISYSISMAGVEELRQELNVDREAGIIKYLQLVSLGCAGDFDEAFELVGLNNPIDNPRFELYAHNIHQLLGIDDDYVPEDDYAMGEDIAIASGNTEAQRAIIFVAALWQALFANN